jgi:hypothetical protein
MHVTVAPLLIIVGAGMPRIRRRTVAPLLALAAAGFAISFLGAFYYYGARGWAAAAAGQNTLEWFAGDRVWNEVEFDALLFSVWVTGRQPAPWTPAHFWAWTPPPDAQPWKTVNLHDYADPQSMLLYYWRIPLGGRELLMFRICLACAALAPFLLAWLAARTLRLSAFGEPLPVYGDPLPAIGPVIRRRSAAGLPPPVRKPAADD